MTCNESEFLLWKMNSQFGQMTISEISAKCMVYGMVFACVCIYKGAKGVMSAIFDMNMELYHMIMMLKR